MPSTARSNVDSSLRFKGIVWMSAFGLCLAFWATLIFAILR